MKNKNDLNIINKGLIPEISEPAKPGRKFPTMKINEEEQKELDNDSINNALLSGSLEECLLIKDSKLKMQCEDSINFLNIIEGGNEKMCEKLHDKKLELECYDKVFYSSARDLKDESLCSKITDEKLKQSCIDFIKLSKSRNTKSADDCNGISDAGLKSECLNQFYFQTSVRSLDTESCENIKNKTLLDKCKATIVQNKMVAEMSKKEAIVKRKSTEKILTDCDQLSGENISDCKDAANYKLALEKRDPSYCNNITDHNKKIECFNKQQSNQDGFNLRLALAKKDPIICNEINNTKLKSDCLTAIQ